MYGEIRRRFFVWDEDFGHMDEKNESASVTRRLIFFMDRETASGFEGMCRLRHMSSVFNTRLARFFF